MWFDYAQGKEKVSFMFNNELDLNNVEFHSFTYHDISKLSLRFNTRMIPETFPKKWTRNQFNSISISLLFTEVRILKIDLNNINFVCTPIIDTVNDGIQLSIEVGQNRFMCLANFMFIDEITPHLERCGK